MSAVLDAIKGRRSVRAYTPEAVSREAIEAILEAGNWSATGANMQPWRFVVVESAGMRRRFRDVAGAVYQRWFQANAETPLGVLRAQTDSRLGADDPEGGSEGPGRARARCLEVRRHQARIAEGPRHGRL